MSTKSTIAYGRNFHLYHEATSVTQNPRDEPFQAWFDLLTTLSKVEGRAIGQVVQSSRFNVQCFSIFYERQSILLDF